MTGADCDGAICDRVLGRCVACRVTADCAAGQRCDGNTCGPATACHGDLDCAAVRSVCDAAAGRCVACNGAADCPDGGACVGHSCVAVVACTSSLQCAATRRVCGAALPPAWPASALGQACADCNSAADCGAGEACVERLCRPVCASPRRVCGTVLGVSCGTCAGSDRCVDGGAACAHRVSGGPQLHQVYTAFAPTALFAAMREGNPTTVLRVALDTGETSTVATLPRGSIIRAFAADESSLYWINRNMGRETIQRLPLAGGAPTTFTTLPGTSQALGDNLVVGNGNVVCTVYDSGTGTGAARSGIYRFDADGTGTFVAARGGLVGLAGADVFWSDFNGGLVGRTALVDGTTTILDRAQATQVIVGGGYLFYWLADATDRPNGLYRVPLTGGTPEHLALAAQPLTVFEDRLYTRNGSSSTDTNRPTLIVSGLDGSAPRSLLLSEDGLYPSAVYETADALFVASTVLVDGLYRLPR